MARPHAKPSDEVRQADWIGRRLAPFDSGEVISVVPGGFEAYARVLHPLEGSRDGQAPGRWADLARWSGVELVPGIHFPEVAMPEQEPAGPEPWPDHAPMVGSLHSADALALAAVLAQHTTTPDRCWFCVWEGWGSMHFLEGPRVELPARSYVLYTGPLTALSDLIDSVDPQSPNLWWPEDHAWCVATEIDLSWTYVGGATSMVNDVIACSGLEAQPALAEHNHHMRAPAWLEPAINAAAAELLQSGTSTLHTWRRDIRAQLDRPGGTTEGGLRIEVRSANGSARRSGWSLIPHEYAADVKDFVTSRLTEAAIEFA